MDADGTADRASEHVGAGDHAALRPANAGLRGDEARRGDQAEPEAHDEAGHRDDGDLRRLGSNYEEAESEDPSESAGPTAGLLRLHADRARIVARETRLRRRFSAAHVWS